MSYHGGPAQGTGAWNGHGLSNSYNRQDTRSPYAQNGQNQYPTSTTSGQYIQQNGQYRPQYSNPIPNQNTYPQPAYYPPQAPQNQYIQPSQLFQTTPAHMGQTHSIGRQTSTPTPTSSTRVVSSSIVAPSDSLSLLTPLAEEYFEAAHVLGPVVSTSMTPNNVNTYQRLIATGLGCLDTALTKGKLTPRMEANVRLRYAGVLHEETENTMEAETALAKGIVLCERNHFFDLKYAMQYLLAQVMAQKNLRAAMKALDGYISEAEAYKHVPWIYALRFLRARFALDSGSPVDINAAIQNLHKVGELATRQQDRAIHLTTSVMEAMVHLRSIGPDSSEAVQRAIAAARTHQLTVGNKIPQLAGLTHLIDVMCAIRSGDTQQMLLKLRDMQIVMDQLIKDMKWSSFSDVMAIPVNSTSKSSTIVSHETRSVVGIGQDGGDVIMMSFLSKKDAFAVSYLLSAIVLLHRHAGDPKAPKYLKEAMENLGDKPHSVKDLQAFPDLLPNLNTKQLWRVEIMCYIRLYLAFCAASTSDWAELKTNIDHVGSTARHNDLPLSGPLGCLSMYLTGVWLQGTGNLDSALRIFQDPKLSLPASNPSTSTSVSQISRDFAILAALNTLWILQEPSRLNAERNNSLLAQLEPLCHHNQNKDIHTAFCLIKATITTNPQTPLFEVKRHLAQALAGAQRTSNSHFLCITLNVMCSKFFTGVVGEQAEKSALAASVQAQKSGNVLWKSVADGMLGSCYDVQGKKKEADEAWGRAEGWAKVANGTANGT